MCANSNCSSTATGILVEIDANYHCTGTVLPLPTGHLTLCGGIAMLTVTFCNELNDNKIGYPSYVPRATHRFTFDSPWSQRSQYSDSISVHRETRDWQFAKEERGEGEEGKQSTFHSNGYPRTTSSENHISRSHGSSVVTIRIKSRGEALNFLGETASYVLSVAD